MIIMASKIVKKLLYVLCLLSLIGIIISYQYLPEMIPTHWNFEGVIDDYSNKNMIFILGLIPIIMMLFFDKLPNLDPKKQNYEKHQKAYGAVQISIVLLMILLSWITIAVSLGMQLKINMIIPAFIGVIFIVMGNYMPTIKPNYFFGIRTPWTLANETVWKKTHKVGGYAFVLSGVLFLIIAFISIQEIMIGCLILMFILLMSVSVYSYIIFQKEQKRDI